MPDDLRCVLQIIKEKRLRDYPGSFGPEQDFCDITLWMNQKFPQSEARLLVDRHYTQFDRQIAGVAVASSAAFSGLLTPIAFRAFEALGYEIQKTGGDSYQCPTCSLRHSIHEALQAFGRVESALRNWPLP